MRPYRKAEPAEAATLYPGGAMLGAGIMAGLAGNPSWALPLVVFGAALFVVGIAFGASRRTPR